MEKSIQQKNSVDKNAQGDALLSILIMLNHNQIVSFHHKIGELKKDLNTPAFNDIAFMMKYGDNRTASSGFKNWVISLGENHYKKTKQSPAHLLTLDDPKLFVMGRAYFNELDSIAPMAYDYVSKYGDIEWYALVQNHRRLEQLEKGKNQNKDRESEIERY
jgi:hypothetical protein